MSKFHLSMSDCFRVTFWVLAAISMICDLVSTKGILLGVVTGCFHSVEIYLFMDLVFYFLQIFRRKLRMSRVRARETP